MTLCLNSKLVSVDPHAPRVTFEGGDIIEGDLIIGADGIKMYRSVISMAGMLADPELKDLADRGEMISWMGPVKHIIGYCMHRKTEYNLVFVHPDNNPNESYMAEGSVAQMWEDFVGWEPAPTPAPASFLPPTPTEVQIHTTTQVQTRIQEWQLSLPGEPDCTLNMVKVPSVRGKGVTRDLLQSQPFPMQKHFNSLSASSALAPSPQIQTRPDYQRSVSAGSAALLARSAPLTQSQHAQLQLQVESLRQRTQYAHLPGRVRTLRDAHAGGDVYPPPAAGRSVPPRSPAARVPGPCPCSAAAAAPHGVQAQLSPRWGCTTHTNTRTTLRRPSGDFKCSASAMGMLGNANMMGRGSGGRSSVSALYQCQRRFRSALTPVLGPRSWTLQLQPMGFLVVPGAANSIGTGAGRDKEKDQASIVLHAMRSVRSMARFGLGLGSSLSKRGASGIGLGLPSAL
ncbi:hypothetical protein B0H14DRAFT_3542312 [Mycena olivaceomarginata]|nr:hypothetical protein B0H14DRAFT_3542312 [Mycena olivaceomarginata]